MNMTGQPEEASTVRLESGSDQTVTNDQLNSLFRQAQVGRCVSSVTHDVNNYLGAILAYAELVQQSPEISEESRRMLGNVTSSVRKSSDLLSTLTAVARKERPETNMITVPQFLEQVVDMKRHECRAARVALELECPSEMPSLVVDRPRVIMALLCLLSNAKEAVEGTENRRVVLSALKTDESIEITVSDSGPGVAESDRESIFKPLYTTKSAEHLGLGLPLARQIAEYHHGSLSYESARGFVLSLPLACRLKIT